MSYDADASKLTDQSFVRRVIKPEEKIAKRFLTTWFGEEPVYEPIRRGLPPDFCIGKTAFEVRRLNQQFQNKDGASEGLEQLRYDLKKAVSAKLSKIPFSPQAGSFFWNLSFRRPLGPRPSRVAKELARKTSSRYSDGLRAGERINVDRATLHFVSAGTLSTQAFVSGGIVDRNAGGWAREVYTTNIKLALRSKIEKTWRIMEKFDCWVLVLVDWIDFEPTWSSDIGAFSLDLGHFNSVAVINREATLAMQYPTNSLNRRST